MNARPPLSGLPDIGACARPLPGLPAPGDLIESPDYAFAFRRLEPVPDRPARLLVALHGADGDELQFADVLAGPRASTTASPAGTAKRFATATRRRTATISTRA